MIQIFSDFESMFYNDPIEEPFWVPLRAFIEEFLK